MSRQIGTFLLDAGVLCALLNVIGREAHQRRQQQPNQPPLDISYFFFATLSLSLSLYFDVF